LAFASSKALLTLRFVLLGLRLHYTIMQEDLLLGLNVSHKHATLENRCAFHFCAKFCSSGGMP